MAAAGRGTLRHLRPPARRPQHARLELLALRALADRPRLSALPAPAGTRVRAAGSASAGGAPVRLVGARAASRPRSCSPAPPAIVFAATRDGERRRRARSTAPGAPCAEPARAHRGRRRPDRRPDLRRRRLHLQRRHHRADGALRHLRGPLEARSRRCRSRSTIPGSTALGGRLYVYGGNLPRRRPRAQVRSPLPLRPRPRPLDAARRRADRARGDGPGRRSAAGSTPPAATRETTSAVRSARDLRHRARALAPRARRCRPAATTSAPPSSTASWSSPAGGPAPVNGGQTTVERYDPAARAGRTLPPLATARSGHAAVAAARPARRLRRRGARRGRRDDRAGRGLRPGDARRGRRCRRWSPRATASAAPPARISSWSTGLCTTAETSKQR